MYNRVILVGHLTRDPELRYTALQGTPVVNFGIATNRRTQEHEETYFGEVVVWGKVAEICKERLRKGSLVMVEGRLKTEKWEQDGVQRSKTRIVGEKVRFLEKKAQESSQDVPEPF